ncbi:MAG: Tm-1-like ATP-binding domain-containing protein [Synergistales bacterium]|nr:Tm-1-like ATP-binding domain-containing protein [Synergistales bacterium]
MKKVYVVGTCDTKYGELSYVKSAIEQQGLEVVLVDVGSRKPGGRADVPNTEVAAAHPDGAGFLDGIDDRGKAVAMMGEALEHYVGNRAGEIAGMIGLGGSGGTSLATRGMRALPIGVPKLMVSTVASGDVSPYVGPNDIAMMYSVTDVAGINKISSRVLGNAAHAMAGMVRHELPEPTDVKPAVGMTMFGVTTPCVDAVRSQLENRYDCLVFHATGTGGQSMEKLLESGMLVGVVDISTTEVCDLHMGGVMSAGEDRFGAVIRSGLPYVGSVGALDMVNFGAVDTVPEHYRNRNLYEHNPQVTLMRTTPEENRTMGEWIADKLNRCEGEVRFLIPLKGVSMIDAEGQPFHDPEADRALFEAIENNLHQTDKRRLIKHDMHINDPAFADELVRSFREIIEKGRLR